MLKRLEEISFPIYALFSSINKIYEEDKVLYAVTTNNITYIIDNKNLTGDLGIRRLKLLKNKENKIFKLTSIPTFKMMLASKSNRFLDANGEVFVYKRVKYYPVEYKKIIHVRQVDDFGYVLDIQGVHFPVKISASFFSYLNKYAKVLFSPIGPIILEYTEKAGKNTKKMI